MRMLLLLAVALAGCHAHIQKSDVEAGKRDTYAHRSTLGDADRRAMMAAEREPEFHER